MKNIFRLPYIYKTLRISGSLISWIVIIYFTWQFMQGADHFLEFTPEALGKYFNYRWFLMAHITFGGAALISGPPQFWPWFRNRYLKLHRWTGIFYLLSILLSGPSAVVLAFTTSYNVNWAYAFSLQVWVSVWIISSLIAYITARKKKFQLHKEWMTRSYLVTLAFVISGLSIQLPFIKKLGSFGDISPSLFWFAWAVPLFIYEITRSYKKIKG